MNVIIQTKVILHTVWPGSHTLSHFILSSVNTDPLTVAPVTFAGLLIASPFLAWLLKSSQAVVLSFSLANVIICENVNAPTSLTYQMTLTGTVPVLRWYWMAPWAASTCHMVWQKSWDPCFLHFRPACQEPDAVSVTHNTNGLTVLRPSKAATVNVLSSRIPWSLHNLKELGFFKFIFLSTAL